MNDYSDILYLMGAMIIFSMLSLNAAHFFRINDQFQYQSEIQYHGIAIAQDIIDEVRWITDKSRLNTNSGNCICNDYPETKTFKLGSDGQYEIDYLVEMEITEVSIEGSSAINRQVEVTVSNEYLFESQKVRMNFMKSFVN